MVLVLFCFSGEKTERVPLWWHLHRASTQKLQQEDSVWSLPLGNNEEKTERDDSLDPIKALAHKCQLKVPNVICGFPGDSSGHQTVSKMPELLQEEALGKVAPTGTPPPPHFNWLEWQYLLWEFPAFQRQKPFDDLLPKCDLALIPLVL